MPPHTCLVCSKYITWQFAICFECEQTYGSRASDWPEWLRYLWAEVQRERRRTTRQIKYELDIDFADLEQSGSKTTRYD